MHSQIIAALCATLAAVSCAGFGSSVFWSAAVLTAGVAVIGVPHGSLDPVVGKRLFRRFSKRWWIPFLTGYVGIGLLIVVGWYLVPELTCLTFFMLAAWHFGLEEDYGAPIKSFLTRHVFAMARGSMIIVAVSTFRPNETQMILSQVIPSGTAQQAETIVSVVQAAGLALVPLAITDLLAWFNSTETKRFGVIIRLFGFATVAAATNPFISFGVYFCGWHSVRGLKELRALEGDSKRAFLRRLAPITITTALIGLIAFATWYKTEALTPSMIRTVFLGLSAIAIPHLVLHACYRFAGPCSINIQPSGGVALCE
ncbi:MAG: Brp/Blh family beta-carotene 15,15'-dioxygenase [Planctomycetota bacterium]|nr:Brp/Blh family beta-carotene 15,15'-dioxygenase [Planctomycetota bacterium]